MNTSINPYSNISINPSAFDSIEEIQHKLKISKSIYYKWKNNSLEEKKLHFIHLIQLLNERKMTLALEITLEMGKPVSESIAEIEKCISLTEWYLNEAEILLKPNTPHNTESDVKHIITYEPIGCILGIMPWNFPYWQVFRFAIPTLLLGNTVLLKHAPNVQGCANSLTKVFNDALFSEGVFQHTHASIESIESIIASPTVQGVTFTGSEQAGKAVATLAGKHLKKCVLELGGSDPFIIFPDTNMDICVEQAIKSRLLNGGQSCIAAKRFIIHTDCYDIFIEALTCRIGKIIIGDPSLIETQMGPMARRDLKIQLQKHVSESIAMGAICTYKHPFTDTDTNFFSPIILEHIPSNAPARREELFGPVFTCIRFTSHEDAIQIANETRFGLGASIWTTDIEKARVIATQLEAGSVFINDMTRSDVRLPFGGIKHSGFGRELSSFGMHEFANIKTYWTTTRN